MDDTLKAARFYRCSHSTAPDSGRLTGEPGMRHPGGRDTVPAARIPAPAARGQGRLYACRGDRRPPRRGGVPWPEWVPEQIMLAFSQAGVIRPWAHQAAMAERAHQGSNVIIATPAASGKSLGYLMPALTAVLRGSTVLYLAPTRALAADQVRAIRALGIPGVCAAVVDGDTHAADRERARTHANYLLTTPDMLHHVLLPRHSRWGEFFGRLHYVIVDECHGYRGVFGSHVAHVLRRRSRRWPPTDASMRAVTPPGPGRGPPARQGLTARSSCARRLRHRSATPGTCARLLTGQDAQAITESTAPRGPLTFGLWEPPLTAARGEGGAPVRRPATAEAATLLADLVAHERRGLAFTRSRRGAEVPSRIAPTRRRWPAPGPPPQPPSGPRHGRPSRGRAHDGGRASPRRRLRGLPTRRRAARGPVGRTPDGTAQPGTVSVAGRLTTAGPGRRVAAYRSGYLLPRTAASSRRRCGPRRLRPGAGVATTAPRTRCQHHARLDAVLIAVGLPLPGRTVAAGGPGGVGRPVAVAVLIARDDLARPVQSTTRRDVAEQAGGGDRSRPAVPRRAGTAPGARPPCRAAAERRRSQPCSVGRQAQACPGPGGERHAAPPGTPPYWTRRGHDQRRRPAR